MKNCIFFLALVCLFSCNKNEVVDDPSGPQLIFKFKFDEDQERLNNLSLPSTIPAGNAAQTPDFKGMSGHYLEMVPSPFTLLGEGEILYQGPETNAGGDKAIDFSQAVVKDDGEVFLSVPLSTVSSGNYQYIRLSLSYQEYDIDFSANGFDLSGRVASFLGYNTYISQYDLNGNNVVVNGNRAQGYFAFETIGQVVEAEVPAGAITVVNPLFDSAPIPAGSCLVTGAFETPLQINGDETEDIELTISLSINQSFEWQDIDGDNKYDPLENEAVVDMGIRGLKVLQE